MGVFAGFGFMDWLLGAFFVLEIAVAAGMLGAAMWATRSGRAGKGRKDVPV